MAVIADQVCVCVCVCIQVCVCVCVCVCVYLRVYTHIYMYCGYENFWNCFCVCNILIVARGSQMQKK